jgi:hypothetical protein
MRSRPSWQTLATATARSATLAKLQSGRCGSTHPTAVALKWGSESGLKKQIKIPCASSERSSRHLAMLRD